MAQNPEFNNLMLVYTAPLQWWEVRPLFYAERLRDFLLHFLDHKMPGFAAVRVNGEDWAYGDQAAASVKRIHDEVWFKGSQKLKPLVEEYVREEVYREFNNHRLEVFLNGERLWAVAEHLGQVPEAIRNPEAIRSLYLGLSIDWLLFDQALFWVPQLRISNFIPSNAHVAPPPPNDYRPPSPMSYEEAAECVKDLNEAKLVFRSIREHFDLGIVNVQVEDWKVRSPVFYYAEPTQMPTEPDGFLTLPSYRSALDRLGSICLGVEGLGNASVVGALLEDNFIIFRREIAEKATKVTRAFHLVLPWWPGHQSREEVEQKLIPLITQWSLLEFKVGYRVRGAYTDLVIQKELIVLWGRTMKEAAHLASELHDLVAYEPMGSPRKQQAYKLVNHLRVMLARSEAKVLKIRDDIAEYRQKMEKKEEDLKSIAPIQTFKLRPLAGIRPLQGTLSNFFPYRRFAESAGEVTAIREYLRETFDRFKEVEEQEQREEQKREEQFREEQRRREEQQRKREEQRQKILNYLVAALAAITAFPILIGQMDWTELREVISRWPGVFRGLGSILEAMHPHLVLVATISAGSAIAFLLGMAAWMAWQERKIRKQEEQEARKRGQGEVAKSAEERWSSIGSKISEAWWLASRPVVVETAAKLLEARNLASMGVPGSNEESIKLRKQIDEWDRAVCQGLAEAWEWLDGNPSEEGVDYPRKVERFIISTELLNNRPAPLPLPLALCLLRYKGPDLADGLPVVPDYEFEIVLKFYDFTDDEVRAIDLWAKLHKHLPAKEFLEELRKVGVSASLKG